MWHRFNIGLPCLFNILLIESKSGNRYAKVSFKNLAGKPITVAAETEIAMANKEVDLFPGSQATLEIQSSEKEPVVFTAKEQGTENGMDLEGNKSVTIFPKADSNYSVTLTVTNPGKTSNIFDIWTLYISMNFKEVINFKGYWSFER